MPTKHMCIKPNGGSRMGHLGQCPLPPPSLSGRAIATTFDRNTIYLVIVVRLKVEGAELGAG